MSGGVILFIQETFNVQSTVIHVLSYLLIITSNIAIYNTVNDESIFELLSPFTNEQNEQNNESSH